MNVFNALETRKVALLLITVSVVLSAGTILAVKAQQPATPSVPEQPPVAPITQPTPELPTLPESQGQVLARKLCQQKGNSALLALTLSTENEAAPTVRLRKYEFRNGQPDITTQVISFQQSVEEITSKYWSFFGRNGIWQGDIALVGKDAFVMLAGISIYDMSVFVYKLNPDVETKATLPLLRLATAEENAEARRRIAQGKVFLPPGATWEEELNKPHWFGNPTDGDRPPLASLTKDYFADGSQLLPREVHFDTVTPDMFIIRVTRELEDKTWSETWKKGPLLYRYDLKTRKWSIAQPSDAEKAERAARVALEKRRELMPDYRHEREVMGLSKEEATGRIRRRYKVPNWEPLPEAWDTPDLVPKYPWLTPTPEKGTAPAVPEIK